MASLSRPQRLQAIERELRQLATEYQAWHDALPDNQSEGSMAAKLEETIETLTDLADEVWAVDPPCIGIH